MTRFIYLYVTLLSITIGHELYIQMDWVINIIVT